MLSTQRHNSGNVPTEHELITIETIADFDQWIDDELARLEESFSAYVTANSAALEWPSDPDEER